MAGTGYNKVEGGVSGHFCLAKTPSIISIIIIIIIKTSSAATGRGARATGGSCGHKSIDKLRQRKKGKSQEWNPERERPEARSKPHMEGGQRHQACDGEQKAKSHPDQDHNQTRPNQPAKEGRGLGAGRRTSAHTLFRIRLSKWNESLLRARARRETCAPQPS